MPADVQGLSTTFLRALTLPLSPWCVGCLPGDAIEQGRHGARDGHGRRGEAHGQGQHCLPLELAALKPSLTAAEASSC